MDGQDPHGVVVGLGQQRLVDPGAVGRAAGRPSRGTPAARRRRPPRRPGPGRPGTAAGATPRRGRRSPKASTKAWRSSRSRSSSTRRAQPPALLPQRPEVGQGDRHRVVGGEARRAASAAEVPAAAGVVEGEQVDVGAGVERRAQRGDEAELVGGVVDGPQRGEGVADLLGVVDERAGVEPVGDVARRRARPAGSGSDVRVGTRMVTSASRAGRHSLGACRRGPARRRGRSRMSVDGAGHVGRLDRPQLPPARTLVVGSAEQQRAGGRRRVDGPRCGVERLVRRLLAGDLVGHERAEDAR